MSMLYNNGGGCCLYVPKRKVLLISNRNEIKSPSYDLLISSYIVGLRQRGRCCFSAACPNRKMYLDIRSADEGALNVGPMCNRSPMLSVKIYMKV